MAAPSNTTSSQLPLAGVELRVGVSMQPPFVIISDSFSDLHGIEVDILRELQKRTGFKLKYDRISIMHFGTLMEQGATGMLDIMAGGILLNDTRKTIFDYSEPVSGSSMVLVARNDGGINKVADLRNRTLAVEKGTVATSLLPNAEALNVKFNENTSAFMNIYAVYSGQADAIIMDGPVAEFYIHNWKLANLKIVEAMSPISQVGLLFKKDAKFTPYLQAAYHDMVEDGTVSKIIDQYMDKEMAATYKIDY